VGLQEAEPIYRLITTILDPDQASAEELAALYHERWEIETAFDELKTHLRTGRITFGTCLNWTAAARQNWAT
jgi:IS4 transposase